MIYHATVDLFNIIQTTDGKTGRMHPTFAGYRPHVVVDHHYMGIKFLDNLNFGCNEARFEELYEDVDYSKLKIGQWFQIKEGNNVVGFGKIIDIQNK